LQGTGVGQPLGIINAGATITVARQAGGTVGYIDLANMDEHFLPQGRGLWVISQSLKSELRQVQDPAGNYVWQPNARDPIPNTIFGWPVIFTEKVPLAGTAGDVLLIDPRYYLVGDRKATTIESTQYDYWRYDQTSWRVVHRVDGQPWLSTWLTMQDGTTTVSPFVMLSDKST
jgi:HK97 family phage major capsid protein